MHFESMLNVCPNRQCFESDEIQEITSMLAMHQQMRAEVIDSFLSKLISGKRINLATMFNLLSARGFLVELEKGHISLSDNSHDDDADFLNELLRTTNIGYIKDRKVYPNTDPSFRNVRKFFQIHEGIEACEHGHWSKWRDFRNRTHGRKVEVRILDPFIARLVKALSAIGLTTSSSCDGHGENKAAVTFCGVYNKAWFRVILDDFIKQRGNLECNWRFEDRECIISHPENRILQLLLEIQSVAKFLYCNRESLRGVKCKVVSSIDADPSIRYRFESEDAAENEIYRVFKSEFLKARSGDPA